MLPPIAMLTTVQADVSVHRSAPQFVYKKSVTKFYKRLTEQDREREMLGVQTCTTVITVINRRRQVPPPPLLQNRPAGLPGPVISGTSPGTRGATC